MDEYRKMLDDLMRSERDVIISNGSAEHATPLIAKLFESANQKVKILSGCLNSEIYSKDEVVNAAGSFLLHDGAFMSIIIEGIEDNDIPALISGSESFIGKIRSRFGRDLLSKISVFKGSDEIKKLPFHFMLVDDKAFRFEPNKKEHAALASFNNKGAAANLDKAMSKWLTSELQPISII
jgi:hypothetical protein